MEGADAVRDFVDRYWEHLMELDPTLGTMVGDERFDDRLPDPSQDGRARREAVHREALRALAGLDHTVEDVALRTSLDMAEAISTRELASIDHRLDRLWAVSHFWGPAQLLGELGAMQRADTPQRLERYLARLAATPAFYRAVSDVAREGVATGVVAPRVVAERTVAQIERLLATPVEGSPALGPVPPQDAAGRERVAAVLRDSAMPALEEYLSVLREYVPHATETIGLSALPGGEAMYRAEILSWTTLPLEAQKVHDLGLEDLERIQEERRLCADRLGYASPEAATAGLASEGNTFASKDELKAVAEEQVRRGREAAPAAFGRMPRDDCQVRLVEEFREADMAFAFYQPPSEDGSRPGIYYVNGYDLPSRPRHHLATTTYHEAIPGHHFQIAIEQEMEGRPALRRFGGLMAGSAFAEGWGLYSERLADELGLFLDERERLGMLDAQAQRAARLIVDTGIHALGWSRERAITQLEEAGVPHTDAAIEADRYITLPGQALTYKIGQFEIEQRRAEAAKREGASFSLSTFHDRLLALGSLPLPALRRELQA
ncbi:MAG TPA: DUF885 domain-containing protein [Actinomycetota bacterium]